MISFFVSTLKITSLCSGPAKNTYRLKEKNKDSLLIYVIKYETFNCFYNYNGGVLWRR